MNKSIKVAKWEIKRNMKNKSFVIGLFLTPVIFIGFWLLGNIFGDSENEAVSTEVYIKDELNVFPQIQEIAEQFQFDMEMQLTDLTNNEIQAALEDSENTAYIVLDSEVFSSGIIPVYTSDDMAPGFESQIQMLAEPVNLMRLEQLGLTDEQMAAISQGIVFETSSLSEMTEKGEESFGFDSEELGRAVPGIFALVILLSIVFTGMMIFQSASQEKKDKIAEIILSSVTPTELMQGKILGYFVLGIIQTGIFLIFGIPFAIMQLDIPILEYLFVPELVLYVAVAILGYLLFSAIFVGIGATMADISTSGNFQGMVLMLPFLPFIFIGPVINDPSGLMAQVGTYIPFSAPGVLILRLMLLEEWPWIEILISLVILIISVWLFMKLAGKIFKVGILMYGKNATPGEILKWLRA